MIGEVDVGTGGTLSGGQLALVESIESTRTSVRTAAAAAVLLSRLLRAEVVI